MTLSDALHTRTRRATSYTEELTFFVCSLAYKECRCLSFPEFRDCCGVYRRDARKIIEKMLELGWHPGRDIPADYVNARVRHTRKVGGG